MEDMGEHINIIALLRGGWEDSVDGDTRNKYDDDNVTSI